MLTRRSLLATPLLLAASRLPSSAAAQQVPANPGAPDVVALWPEGVPGRAEAATPEVVEEGGRISNVHDPSLTVHLATGGGVRAAVIVCPGGGYRRLAFVHEGTEVAAWLNSIGVSAFILKYRMAEYGHPAPLRDVLRAVRTVRSQAARWNVDAAKIGVMGFSAGGHLASCAGTLFDAPEGRTGAAIDATSARPDFVVLVYPVIAMTPPLVHAGSRENLLGANPSAELVSRLSTDQQVTARTPPTFLVHGGTDTTVPPENSVSFYSALRKAGVPGELHLYQEGPHGIGLRPGHGPMSEWPARCAEWMRVRGILPHV
jgi:acetyl esterase/lipase